jgi:2-oxoglutarate dehydrogenase complex dihydrolipoamide succinyltransferase (E2) component
MPTTIVMPQLGESVAEGIIGKWLKQEGDRVERDEPFVEVITDKVNAEIPSPVAGVLLKLTQPEGATVPVGDEIAIIGDEDADTATTAPAAAQGQQQSDGSNGAGAERGAGSAVAVATKPPATEQATQRDGRSERVRSSPLVRRLADEHGVNLEEVPGTGIGGRVSKNDILQFVAQRGGGTATAPTAAPAESRPPAPAEAPKRAGASEERIPISPIRKLIAERMTVSKTTIPHAVTIVEVDMTNAVRYRDGRKDEFRQRAGVSLSFVAFVIKATVEALKEYPDVNSEWGGDHILRKNDINISVAVDAPDGLITPVIHSADQKSLAALSQDITDLAVRARSKKLTVHDMQGGTFTVNNTGALGSVWSMSIIPPPQCGILAAGAIVKRPVVIEQDGQDLFAVRHMMNLSFSFDHRILDGGYAAGFVESVKRKLEAWSPDFPLY